MSFLDGVSHSITSAAGAAINAITETTNINASGLFPFGGKAEQFPQDRVLTSQVTISFIVQNFGVDPYDGETEFLLGEVDNFQQKMLYTPIKKWKPFGFKTEKVLMTHSGWDLSFSGGKIDQRLSFFNFLNEQFVQQENTSIKFGVKHLISYSDGSVESYLYKDCILMSYDQDNAENNAQIPEKFTIFSPEREVTKDFVSPPDLSKITDRVGFIINIMNKINKS